MFQAKRTITQSSETGNAWLAREPQGQTGFMQGQQEVRRDPAGSRPHEVQPSNCILSEMGDQLQSSDW